MDPKPTSYFFICLKISSERLAREKDELPSLDLQEQKKKGSREKTQKSQEVILEKKKKKKRTSPEVILDKKTKRVKKEIVVLDHHRHHLPTDDLSVDDDEANKKETVVDLLGRHRHHLPTDDFSVDDDEAKKQEIVVLDLHRHHLPADDLSVDDDEANKPFWREMKASRPTFAFCRKLERSDVRKSQSRCFLNRGGMEAVLVPALSEDEKDDMMELKKGLKVLVVDHMRRRYEMVLKWWPSIKQFALNQGWLKLVGENQLEGGDLIRVSYFRYGDGDGDDDGGKKKLGLFFDCRHA